MIRVISLCLFMFFSAFAFCQLIKVETHTNYDKKSLLKLDTAVHLLDSILKTDIFRERVLNAKFISNRKWTNEDIYNGIFSGNTKFDSSYDKILNFYLSEYPKYAGGNETGITIGKITNTHRCFILKHSAVCLARHLMHEYMHVMGFHHYYDSQAQKDKTVPYVIGNIIKSLLDNKQECGCVKKDCY